MGLLMPVVACFIDTLVTTDGVEKGRGCYLHVRFQIEAARVYSL